MKKYTTKKIGDMLGITAQTVINYCDAGKLACTRMGTGPRKCTAAEILQFTKEQKCKSFLSTVHRHELEREAAIAKNEEETGDTSEKAEREVSVKYHIKGLLPDAVRLSWVASKKQYTIFADADARLGTLSMPYIGGDIWLVD